MDSMFESGGVEAMALCFALVIAVPSFVMFCFILDEAPLKFDRPLDDTPVFIFWSATDMFGQGWGTLICLFFVSFMLFGFAILGTSWYTVWRGNVAWNSESTSLSDMIPSGAALLQAGHHSLSNSTHHVIHFSGRQLWESSSSLVAALYSGPTLVALASAAPKVAASLMETRKGKDKSATKSLRTQPVKRGTSLSLQPDE